MSKKEPALTTTNKQLAPGTDQTLSIRKPHSGEVFYPTGNGILRYCIRVEEYVGNSGPIFERYMTIVTPSHTPASVWAKPILFREAVSETAERFAVPQSLGDLEPDQCTGAESELKVFGNHLGLWIATECCVDEDRFYSPIRAVKPEDLLDCRDFADLLDAALSPDAIDRDDHPINDRLEDFVNDLIEEGSIQETGEAEE